MDETFFFTPSDEEIEALVSMSPEEVNAELIELGLDPDAPLPERIKNLIAAQEDQNAGSSAGGTLHYISAEAEKFRFKHNSLKKQRSQATRHLLQRCAAILIGAILIGALGLIRLSDDMRSPQGSPENQKLMPRPFVSRDVDEATEKRVSRGTQNPNTGSIVQPAKTSQSDGRSAKAGRGRKNRAS